MIRRYKPVSVTISILISLILASCQSNELTKIDDAAGLNGSFETTSSGYPVNWAFFPNPESDDIFRVSIDQTKALSGKQSVKLSSNQSEITVGLRSRRVSVEPGNTYLISFAIRNDGCTLKVRRILQNQTGKTNYRSNIIFNKSDANEDWETFRETLLISEGERNLVLIFLIDGPGSLWVDDVRIEKVPQ